MQNIAVVDAGPLIALFDKSDRHHQKVRIRLGEFRKSKHGKLATTWPVIMEAACLLNEHVCLEAQLDLLNWISGGGVEIFDLKAAYLPRIIEMQKRYASFPMDFADGTLLMAAEELKVTMIFSLDKDFSIYRILGKNHFENLL
jgi:uncharacterized protein